MTKYNNNKFFPINEKKIIIEKNDNLIKNKNKRINNTFKFLIIITKQINIKSQTIQSQLKLIYHQ